MMIWLGVRVPAGKSLSIARFLYGSYEVSGVAPLDPLGPLNIIILFLRTPAEGTSNFGKA